MASTQINRLHHGCWLVALLLGGCSSVDKAIAPSNARTWAEDQAVLAMAEFDNDQVTVRNVRFCKYFAEDEYIVHHYDQTYDLSQLASVDFIVVPFDNLPSVAHTMLSFGFADGKYLCVSAEIRKEYGEEFAVWKGGMRQYELMYIVADERDLIKLRTNHRHEQVYVYPTKATNEQARALFVDVMERVNKLAISPEFYDTVTNNCTTNIAQHVNALSPGLIPFSSLGVIFPGFSDRLAYDLGMLDTTLSFEATKAAAHVNAAAEVYGDAEDFSVRIRQARDARITRVASSELWFRDW